MIPIGRTHVFCAFWSACTKSPAVNSSHFTGRFCESRGVAQQTIATKANLIFMFSSNLSSKYCNGSFGQRIDSIRASGDHARDRWPIGVGIALRSICFPDILLAAECHPSDRTAITALPLRIVKDDPYLMGVRLVAVDQHERPVSIGAVHGVGRDEHVALAVLDVRGRWIHFMHSRAMLYPLDVDHARAPIRRGISGYVVVAIGDEVGPACRSQTRVLHSLRLDRRMVERRAATFEKGPDVVGQPKGREDRAHRPGQP